MDKQEVKRGVRGQAINEGTRESQDFFSENKVNGVRPPVIMERHNCCYACFLLVRNTSLLALPSQLSLSSDGSRYRLSRFFSSILLPF